MKTIFHYPTEVIMVLTEAIKGKKQFYTWLTDNDYEHLAQFSLAVSNNRKAFNWLLEHYPQYAAFDRAIDNDAEAKIWLHKNGLGFDIILADACAGKSDAIAWLAKNGYDLYIYLAKVIKSDIDERDRYRSMF
jgi:hypothetical protein